MTSQALCIAVPVSDLERGEGDFRRGRRERGCGEEEEEKEGSKGRPGGVLTGDEKDVEGVRLGVSPPLSTLSLFFASSLTYMALDGVFVDV